MAYENYSQVSWTDGTPITGDRLQQMSTNIQQVKEATTDSPEGIKKLKVVTSNTASYTDFSNTHEIINLTDESGTGGGDNRVTISANRFYRVTLNFTGFVVDTKGAEDCTYILSLHTGTHGSANTMIYSARFTPPPFAYIDVSRFGAGSHSVVLQSNISGFSNEVFFAAINRIQGASATNAPAYYVPASATVQPLQMYVEDVGGAA
jgi:hypothetical protein